MYFNAAVIYFCSVCYSLGKKIEVPTFMKEIDIKNGLRNAEDLQKVDKFVLHFMPNSFVNFSLDMSGSSIWHHVIQVSYHIQMFT